MITREFFNLCSQTNVQRIEQKRSKTKQKKEDRENYTANIAIQEKKTTNASDGMKKKTKTHAH